nr:immunoglobulin light chain junction region [Macaca mulatta]MOY09113.1 immunoglobulin light chain junction region [Macaca mulatta]
DFYCQVWDSSGKYVLF